MKLTKNLALFGAPAAAFLALLSGCTASGAGPRVLPPGPDGGSAGGGSGGGGGSSVPTGAGGGSGMAAGATGNAGKDASSADTPVADAVAPVDASTDGSAPDSPGGGVNPGWPSADAAVLAPPDFGPNVLIFDPSMSATAIQSQLDTVAAKQNANTPQTPVGFGYGAEYSTSRYAYLFKPGQYTADVKIGYYVQALGLGRSPDDVTITGAVRSKADWRTDDPGDALLNFWRGAENLAVVPTLAADARTDVWAVS